ncbi:hypothetical protein [Thalassospira marina]|uniref:Uncharacterized protein n=1 Tax=Thalassospira marina TaxID=2048283 RepID=A0ABM6Q4V6_9PROT|nr:hypothetical protein [Thalassospira marina]AUG51506.1 hypothetical protein CSC3H3_01365 [Thalassospira marina]AUG55916.1 hypothetical protein CSC3H3_24190 [Thalassospira marina]
MTMQILLRQCGQRARQTLLFLASLLKSYCLLGLISFHVILIWWAVFEPDILIQTIKALQVITPDQLSGIMRTALAIWTQLFVLGLLFLLLLGVLPFWPARPSRHSDPLSENTPKSTGAPQ